MQLFVQKLFNAKNYCTKYFRHKIFQYGKILLAMPIYRPQLASKCCIMPKMHSGNGRQIILCAVNMVYALHVCIAPVGSMDHLSCQILAKIGI